jgi:rhamnogalacturonan endolyase
VSLGTCQKIPEGGCVVLDQPQHASNVRRVEEPAARCCWSSTQPRSFFKQPLKSIITSLLLVAPFVSAPALAAAEPPPVKCVETENAFTLDNGILRAEIGKRTGNLDSLKFRGKELLAQNGGYWSSVGRVSRGTPGQAASVLLNTPDRAEVSCRIGNVGGATNIPLDTDFRYSLGRGESVLHVAAILHHAPGNPAYETGESRYCLKLNPQVFNFLSVDKDRQRLMPSGYDWDHGTQMNLKEARRLTTGIHRGEVEHKYDYSALFAEMPAYGWFGIKSQIGLWIINPSLEYIGGGPTKVELTGHLDVNPGGTPTLLNMWQGSHYGGTSLSVAPDEEWTKVIGPFAIYCNSRSTAFDAWRNALARATNEMSRWPYAWFVDKHFPPSAERGILAGKIILHDTFASDAAMSNVWVGVAAPDYLPPDQRRRSETNPSSNYSNRYGFPPQIEWQRDAKFYQFWTRADASGNFEIRNIRPGAYTLHAFGDGVMGEFAMTNVVVAAGETKSLGELVWQPLRFGRTLWEIGIPDRTAREFRHGDHFWRWGLYLQYPQEFPNDVNFIIGQSDWSRDWNYAQPPRITSKDSQVVAEDEETTGSDNADSMPVHRTAGLEPTTWRIQFNLTNAPTGKATLRLAFAGARDGSKVALDVNDHFVGDTGRLPATGVMHRDGIRGYWFERDLTFDAALLHAGTNIFELTSAASNWTQGVLYDCVRLELDEKK